MNLIFGLALSASKTDTAAASGHFEFTVTFVALHGFLADRDWKNKGILPQRKSSTRSCCRKIAKEIPVQRLRKFIPDEMKNA